MKNTKSSTEMVNALKAHMEKMREEGMGASFLEGMEEAIVFLQDNYVPQRQHPSR